MKVIDAVIKGTDKMATGSALNLSLLSRGVGEVTRNGTEKVDVIFEPQVHVSHFQTLFSRVFYLIITELKCRLFGLRLSFILYCTHICYQISFCTIDKIND